MTPPTAGPDSAQVRSQLVTSLELELVGPTQRVLQALGPNAEGLHTEVPDRLPSSCCPTGFLVPTKTDLSLKCDDTADDDFAGVDGVDQRKPSTANSEPKPRSGDDGGTIESGPARAPAVRLLDRCECAAPSMVPSRCHHRGRIRE